MHRRLPCRDEEGLPVEIRVEFQNELQCGWTGAVQSELQAQKQGYQP